VNAMRERGQRRRDWLAGAGALVVASACERTQSPAAATERSSARPFERLATLSAAVGAPRQIVVHEDGRALVVTSAGFALVERGRAEMHPLELRASAVAVRAAEGFVLGLTPYAWSGRAGDDFRTGGMLDGDGRRQLALAQVGSDWITVVQSGLREEEWIAVRRQPPRGPSRWAYQVPGKGAGAIAPDGRVALALWDGRVILLGDRVGSERAPQVLADTRLDPWPYAIACADTGVSLLTAAPILDHEDGGLRIAPLPDWTPARDWTSTLVELGPDGRERWRVELPFAGLQVLRRGDGSIVVAGVGAALVANGELAWSRTDRDRVHAALASDDVVLAHGTTIERVDTSGRARTTAAIGEGPIACVPAVEPSGAIWVATANGVWRGG